MMVYRAGMIRFTQLSAILLVVLLCIGGGLRANEADFVDGFEDLPLMPGLAVDDQAGLLFDKPSGRIAEAVAGGAVPASEIRSFYGATLPELGWQPVGSDGLDMLLFRRSDETLRIEIRDEKRIRLVRFLLTPG